ncbi:MAG: GAF domain-containing sensor histidine kinase [Anaerolineaceae bacterium]|nr:GAF domain-containing sensor histidine kinase [Anaerolineaceae bacterium]
MTEQYHDYTRRLERLLEVCRNLSTYLDLQPFLQSIIEAASDLTLSESSLILVYEKEENALRVAAAPFYQLDALQTIAVPLDSSIAGSVYRSQQSFLYRKTARAEGKDKALDWECKAGAESLIAVPLIYQNQAVGVLEAWNKTHGNAYNEQDLLFLDTLAAQAATAYRNQHLIQESEAAYQKVLELDRMKSDFIAITSHELRTPLGHIIGHSAFLAETATAAQKEDVTIIEHSAARLKELIEEIGDVDHLTSGLGVVKRQTVSISLLLQQAVESFQELANARRIRLSLESKQANLSLEGDAEKIAIILHNLIQNALIFTNPGGVVKVTAERLPGFIKIAVLDNGIGIPQSEQENVFKRFYQVEKHLTRKHGGLGLGLSIAREMVELHGGKIWVESVESKGSRFSFILPLNAAQASAAEKVFLQ